MGRALCSVSDTWFPLENPTDQVPETEGRLKIYDSSVAMEKFAVIRGLPRERTSETGHWAAAVSRGARLQPPFTSKPQR